MPQASRFSSLLPSLVTKIALRVRNRMNKLGLNEGELARHCNQVAQELFPDGERPRMSRERIAKILMNCKARPEKSAARVISSQEIAILSRTLKVSPEWLAGQEDNRDPVFWNPLAEPQRAEHILHLLEEYEEKTGEIIVWAEFLLCSLLTPEFMHEFHEAHFAELDPLGLYETKQKAVQTFDLMGNARRKRLFDAKRARTYSFTQLIFLSELEKIVKGTFECSRISQELRKSCLKNLQRIVADRSLRIDLIVVRDSDARDIQKTFRDYGSLGVCGDKFTMWGYHSGSIAWSEHQHYIHPHRLLLHELKARATYRRGEDVSALLKQLRAVMQ